MRNWLGWPADGAGMGIVMNTIRLTNNTDLTNSRQGLVSADEVRSVEMDALVDTGASELAIPEEVVQELGLPIEGERPATLADGRQVVLERATGVRVELVGRDMTCDVLVLPAGATPLIGHHVLQSLDLIVDPSGQRVLPRDPNEQMTYLLRVA